VRRVYGTYRNVLSLNMEPGTWSASITGRIVNTLAGGAKQIFRPGVIGSGNLNTIEGQPSIDLQLPVTDDPDNSPSGGAVILTITFAAGGSEVFTISPLEAWPVGTTGGSGGTDLATLLDPASTPSAPPYVMLGVAGGVAELDADGDVIDAAGGKLARRSFLPESYGAVGDGTTDDTAAIEAARVAAVAAGGGSLLFKSDATYSVSKITVSTGIAYVGNGCTVKGSSSTTEGVFQAQGWGPGTPTITDAEISGFTIDCNATAKRGVFLYLADRCRVLSNRIFSLAVTSDGGVRLHQNTTDCTVRGNHITLPSDSPFGTVAACMGIACVSTATDAQGGGQNNTLTFGAASNLSKGHTIADNWVYNGTHGVSLYAAQDCRVTGNYLYGQSHRGVILSPIATGNVITKNTIREYGSSAIHLAWGSCENTITDNRCKTSVSANELDGIKGYYGCSDNIVTGNHVDGPAGAVVRFAMGSARNLIAANKLKGAGAGVRIQSYLTGAGYYQPTTPPAADGNKIHGNIIDAPTGISLEASVAADVTNTSLSANDLRDPATVGVVFTEADSRIVSGVTAVGQRITGAGTKWTLPRRDAHFALKSANTGLVETVVGLGVVRTVVPPGPTGLITIGTANSTRFYRVIEGGTVSALRVNVGVQSGNIAVAVYANSGSGLSSTPGTRLATSGSVACPAVGVQDVALGSTVVLAVGDWVAFGCDNATATFSGMSGGGDGNVSAGQAGTQSTFPPAATPTLAYQNNRLLDIIGVP
jgi:nitrous oxidase accessory protein NosD